MKNSKILKLFSQPRVTVPLLLLLVAFSYANTLYSPFVLDDTHSFIEEPNVFVRNWSFDSISKLSETFFGKARFIPMVTFAMNHYLANGGMPIYHVTNILIHLFSILAVYWLIIGLLKTTVGRGALRGIPAAWFAFSLAALWALNPVQTNAVTYIVQRMTSLSALFYVTALVFYVHARLTLDFKKRCFFYTAFGTAALCAFLSKENSYMLPFTVLLVEWVFLSPDLPLKIIRAMRWYHWLAILLLIIVLLPLAGQRWAGIVSSSNFRPFTWEERLLTQSRVVLYYITLLFLPLPRRMNFDYDFPLSHSLLSPPTTLAAIFLLAVPLIWAFYKRKEHPLAAFGIFWFFLNLAIESTVIPLELVFEHRLYLPSIGFYMVCLAGLDRFVALMKEKFTSREVELVFVLLMVILLSLNSIGTSVRNNVWRDSYSLYSDCAQKSPEKPRSHLNLGVAMGRDKNLKRESIKEFEKVIALGKPKRERYILAANNIVVAYAELGEYEEAIAQGEKYLAEAPDYVSGGGYPKLMSNLAYAYKKTGQYSEAVQSLASGLTKEQRRLNGYLVNSLTAVFTEAYDHEIYRKKLSLTEEEGNKYVSVRLRMARLLSDLRDYDKANDFLQAVVDTYPEHPAAEELNESIQAKLVKNRKQEAAMSLANHPPYTASRSYRAALKLADFIFNRYSPLLPGVGWLLDRAEQASAADDPFVLWYRIKWYMKTRETEKLVQALEEAARVQPDFVPLVRLTGEFYEQIGDGGRAVKIYRRLLDIYPGEPAWQRYENKIIAFNESKNTE